MSSGTGSTDQPCGTQKDVHATRGNTKKTGTSIPLVLSDVHTAVQGRKFLEKRLLLCPIGEPFTHNILSTSLHQVTMMSSVPRLAADAICALAYLVDELEEMMVNEIVRDAVNTQLSELTMDMKLLIEDTKEKIDKHVQNNPPSSHTHSGQSVGTNTDPIICECARESALTHEPEGGSQGRHQGEADYD